MNVDYLRDFKQQVIKEVLSELQPVDLVNSSQKRLTTAQAAFYTGLSEDTIYTLCREKQIPHYRGGTETSKKPKILFRKESLDRWMGMQERLNCRGWEDHTNLNQ